MNVYPEFLPARVRNSAGESRLQSFRSALKDSGLEHIVLDVLPVLHQAKQETQVFFKTDTHWNQDGAFIVYQEIMNKLSQWIDGVEPVTRNMLDRAPRLKMGDIAIADRATAADIEHSETLKPRNSCAGEHYPRVEAFTETPAYQAKPKSLPLSNGCASKNNRALVVHDSFGAYMRQFLSESFEQVIFMRSYDIYGMKSFIEEFKPDVFIDLRAERRFHYLLATDPVMQSELEAAKVN